MQSIKDAIINELKNLQVTFKENGSAEMLDEAQLSDSADRILTVMQLDGTLQLQLPQAHVIRSVCSHPKAEWKNTPWGYKICGLCNDIVEQTDV